MILVTKFRKFKICEQKILIGSILFSPTPYLTSPAIWSLYTCLSECSLNIPAKSSKRDSHNTRTLSARTFEVLKSLPERLLIVSHSAFSRYVSRFAFGNILKFKRPEIILFTFSLKLNEEFWKSTLIGYLSWNLLAAETVKFESCEIWVMFG